jgi:hypothetical protein
VPVREAGDHGEHRRAEALLLPTPARRALLGTARQSRRDERELASVFSGGVAVEWFDRLNSEADGCAVLGLTEVSVEAQPRSPGILRAPKKVRLSAINTREKMPRRDSDGYRYAIEEEGFARPAIYRVSL